MRRFGILALATAFTTLLSAQAEEDRTVRFRSAATEQDYQDLSVAALSMSGLKARAGDAATRELSFSGPADQVRAAEWVIAELDRPMPSTPPPPSNLYTLQTKEPDNTIGVFYPSQISSNQDLAEVATAIRTISDVRYVGMFTSHRAIVLRGTREQVDLVEWLLAEVNRDAPQQVYVYPKIPARPDIEEDNQVRVFRFVRAPDVQQFNEAQTMIRTLTDTRRVYPYVGKRAIVMRGTAEQMDMTQWILAQLDKSLPLAQKSTSGDYAMKSGDVMRMFFFSGAMTQQAFNEAGTSIRTATGIRRFYPFAAARTLAARGTAAQIAQLATLAAQ